MSERRVDSSLSISERLESLGIDPCLIASRNLPIYAEAKNLVVADVSKSGRKHMLTPPAANAWLKMKASAKADGVSLIIVSAFRSVKSQVELVKCKLDQGDTAESIFMSNAPPGHSEHHTGHAIDIGTLGCQPLTPEFEATQAYAWLSEHAHEFGFRLSYPEGNELGFCYEPWHWRYHNSDT